MKFTVIIDAIAQLRGVCTVTPSVANVDDMINRERVKHELLGKMLDLVTPNKAS